MLLVWLSAALLTADVPASTPTVTDANAVVRDYELRAVAQLGACKITIHPRAPWSLKATTPLEAVLQAANTMTLAKESLSEKDYVDPKAADKTLVVQITSPTPADARVKAALNFFLCTDQVCQRYRDTAECNFGAVAQLP